MPRNIFGSPTTIKPYLAGVMAIFSCLTSRYPSRLRRLDHNTANMTKSIRYLQWSTTKYPTHFHSTPPPRIPVYLKKYSTFPPSTIHLLLGDLKVYHPQCKPTKRASQGFGSNILGIFWIKFWPSLLNSVQNNWTCLL